MSRPQTITNDEILAVARKMFRAQGHAASTRQIAESAGISEGVLYQRFGADGNAKLIRSAREIQVLRNRHEDPQAA